MDFRERGTFLDLDGALELLHLLRRQLLPVLQEHVAVALDPLRGLVVNHRHDPAPGLVHAVVQGLYDMEAVDDDRGAWQELLGPGVVRAGHVHADRPYVLLKRGYLPLEPPQCGRALASGDLKHGLAVLVAHSRDVLAAWPFVPEHVQLVDADVRHLAVVPASVSLAQPVLDCVADGAPRYAVFLREGLHRHVCRAGKQFPRERSGDAGVLVRGECGALVCHGLAILADHFSHWHDEAHLALAVRQPCQCPVTMPVCRDTTGPAFWTTCIWRLQIKAQNAVFSFQPKFAL